MYDLEILEQGRRYDPSRETPARLALIHRSFRVIDKQRGLGRKGFGSHFPPLGLLNMAHSLRMDAAAGHLAEPQIRLFDEETFYSEGDMYESILRWLAGGRKGIVASTTYTSTIDKLELFLSRFDPAAHLIIVGGAHVSLAPHFEHAHIVVRGEGGAALRHILNTLFTPDFGQGPEAAGVCYQLGGDERVVKQAFDRSLETLPPPAFAYDLLPEFIEGDPAYNTNLTRMLGERPQIYICTQSCRARCTFCSTYLIHGSSKSRPVGLIREDLHYLVRECGYDCLEFHDDDLLQHADLDGLLEILREMGVPWFCFGRVDTITDEVARKLADAGCRRIFLGIESMDQATLDYYNKASTVEENQRAVQALSDAGVDTVAGFIIGAPHDTVESILSNLDTYLALPLYGLSVSVLSPDPGTVEFRRARKRGGDLRSALGGESGGLRLLLDLEKHGPETPAGLPTVCRQLDKKELNRLIVLIESEFYFRQHILDGLKAGRTQRQAGRVDEFYRFLAATVVGTERAGGHPLVVERLTAIEARLASPPWANLLSKAAA